jgi:hypothetical protein
MCVEHYVFVLIELAYHQATTHAVGSCKDTRAGRASFTVSHFHCLALMPFILSKDRKLNNIATGEMFKLFGIARSQHRYEVFKHKILKIEFMCKKTSRASKIFRSS